MKVVCNIDYIELKGDFREIDGVSATCTECGNVTESYGTSEASIRRCLTTMREECPTGETNFYIGDDA